MKVHNSNSADAFLLSNTNNKFFDEIPGIKKEHDFKSMLSGSLININDVIPQPPVCIEVILNDTAYTFGTLGNFSLLIGKAKAGKTFALSLILAAALVNGQSFQKVLRATLPANKKNILYFDTEQSRYHVHRVLKRICAISGVFVPDNLTVYSLRKHDAAERLEMIDYALNNTPNIGIVVIDGIRDLVTSINDEEQASMISSNLLKWSEVLNIHIVTVLHQNKGDLNARGHLGTELTNKSETVTSVSKGEDKDISIISAEYCRDKEFLPIAFNVDINGLPNIVDGFAITSKTEQRKKLAPYDVPHGTHKIIINEVFSIQGEMLRSELKIAAGANISRNLGYDIGKNKTDEWISHWLQFKHVKTSGTPGTKACKYSINTSS